MKTFKKALKGLLQRRFPTLLEKVMVYRAKRIPRSQVFSEFYRGNRWMDAESRSGVGSRLAETVNVRAALPRLIRDLGVRTFLDAPCGDLNWMRHVELGPITYLGADIVPELIADNARTFAVPERQGGTRYEFQVLDLVTTVPPEADLVLCRDCLVHLSNRDALKALQNIRASGSKYLLATTFVDCQAHSDIIIGWRRMNLQVPPFSLPEPMELIDEGSTEADQADKRLGLWDLRKIPGPVDR